MDEDLIVLAFVTFGPIYLSFRVEHKYQVGIKSFRELLVLIAVTLATTSLFFSYIVVHKEKSIVYYLLVFSIGGILVDLITRTYPGTGALCHVVSVAYFSLFTNLSNLFFWPSIAILALSITAFLGSVLKRKPYIRTIEPKDKTLLSERW